MAITRSQMKRQLYSIGGGAIKGTDAGNGREGFFKPIPGSPMANLLNTLPPNDPRHYGIGFGPIQLGGFGPRQPRQLPMGVLPQGGEQAVYPRLGDLRSGVSSAEQELQQINQSIDEVQSDLGSPTGGEFGDYSSIINPIRPGGQGSTLSSTYSNNYIGDRGSEQSSPISQLMGTGFGAVGDPRLGAPDVPNSLQQIMRGARADGGMMGRQQYGLGSFVKKAVKGVTGAVKSFVKSDLGKTALLGAAAFGIPGTSMGGLFGRASFMTPGGVGVKGLLGKTGIAAALPSVFGIPGGAPGKGTSGLVGKAFDFLKTPGGAFAGITAASALAAAGIDPENPNEMPRNTEALKSYLRQGYLTLNPQAQPDEVEEFVEANTVEYRANGGRIGFAEGMLSFEEAKAMNPGMFSAEVETDVVRPNTELLNYIKRIRDSVKKGIIPMDFAMDLVKQKTMEQGVDLQDLRDDIMETQRIEQAYGGRMGYAFGNPEQNAINASGIMNLPLNQNPAGVTELDLRDSGGFIPPVGVKEKADDIPAMLSNNEFVFTADAVRGMGDGNVNKGAQRMYDMMKKLENGGRV
jgi:hypothetical protein